MDQKQFDHISIMQNKWSEGYKHTHKEPEHIFPGDQKRVGLLRTRTHFYARKKKGFIFLKMPQMNQVTYILSGKKSMKVINIL